MNHDERIGDLLGTAPGDTPARAVLIGRSGATAIRAQLHALTPDAAHPGIFTDLMRHTRDAGDIAVAGDRAADHATLGRAVADALANGAVPIVLGGGPEATYGHFLGHAGQGSGVDVLRWSAHAGVAQTAKRQPHDGGAMRQALTHASGLAGRVQVAGLQPHAVAAADLRWLREHGGRAFWVHDLTRPTVVALYDELQRPTMVSLMLDAVDQAFAPGVDAPATGGLTPDLWLFAARSAGRCASVRSVDVSGLNPALDRDHQTARLAALTAWHFLAGLAERSADR